MAHIGIIACQILELELAHLLSTDTEVSDIFVVDNEFSEILFAKLKNHGKKPVHRLAFPEEFVTAPGNGHHVLIRIMEVGLHSDMNNLRRQVVSAVKEMARYIDGVLLGYGLCGNALDHAQDLFSEANVPVVLPMDEDHPVDDCVGLIIGGRENYYAQQCECAGTMFINSGFSRHWEQFMCPSLPEKLLAKKDRFLTRLFKNYQRSLLLPTEVMEEAEMRENTEAFNARFGLRIESTPGTLALLEKAWQEAKSRSAENVDEK